MKSRPFKIPKTGSESFIVQDDKLPYFYDRLHTHPEIQITYILAGSGTRFMGGSIGPFQKDQMYIIGSNIPHMFKNHDEYYNRQRNLTAHSISLFFRKEAFGEAFWEIPELSRIKHLLDFRSNHVLLTEAQSVPLRSQFKILLNLNGLNRLTAFLQLLQELAEREKYFNALASDQFVVNSDEEDGKRLNDVFTFITQNYMHPISISEIASVANLSPPSFCRYFKTHTRKSFITFLNAYRIGVACKLLPEKKYNIAQICFQCGFNNISNFNRQFKKVTGYTPSEYVRKTR